MIRFALARYAALVVLLAGCGPTFSEPSATGGESSDGADDSGDDDDGESASDGAMDTLAPCEPAADAEQGWIRVVDGGFQIDFGEYEWGDEVFGCESEPPCEGPDGEHLRLLLPQSGEASTPFGEYSIEAGTLSGSERWCGCCNGEGGGPDEWDNTRMLDDDRLQIDGADASCISGRWLEEGGFPSERSFVAVWCG